MPVYHRFYDATLLLLPLGWYVANFCSAMLSHRCSLLLWVPFFIPFASVLRWWASNHPAPGWFLETFVRLSTNWCLLGLALFLLASLYDASRDQRIRLNPVRAAIATKT
jgi:hypothetical protein